MGSWLPLKGAQLSIFGGCLLWPKGWTDQDAAWYGGRPRPRRHYVRREPSPSPQKGHGPQFSAHVYCGQTVAHPSYCWALVTITTPPQFGRGNAVTHVTPFCLIVGRMSKKRECDFHKIWGIGRLRTREELIEFCKVTVSAYTAHTVQYSIDVKWK